MELAHVIKGLLSVECSFRLIACLIANSLRGAFILWGWQPTLLIQIVAILETAADNYGMAETDLNIARFNCTKIQCHGKRIAFYNPGLDQSLTCPNILGGLDLFQFYIKPTIKSVCLLPESISTFTSYGISIFVLFTGVLR